MHLLVKPTAARARERRTLQLPVKIANVTYSSYGADEDGEVVIWASGEAGWFRLQPSPAYKAVFEEMERSVKVFYFVADAYKAQPKLKFETLCEKYLRGNNCPSVRVAKERILHHRVFLALRMLKGAEGVRWEQTSLYQHLKKFDPHVFHTHTQVPEASRKSKSQSLSSSSVKTEADDAKPGRPSRRGKPSTDYDNEQSTSNLQRNDYAAYQLQKMDIKSKVNALWAMMQSVATYGQALTLATIGLAAYQCFTFEDEMQATDYVVYYGPELVSKIQHKHFGKQRWLDSEFYSELLNAKLSRSAKAKIAQLNIQKRPNAMYVPQSNFVVEVTSSEEEVLNTRRSRHIKGGLRPKSGKSTGKKGKSYTGPAKHLDMDVDDISESSTSRKRKSTFKDGKPTKRARSLAASSNSTTPQTHDEDDEDDDQSGGGTGGEDVGSDEELDEIPAAAPPSHEHSSLAAISTPSHDALAANAPGDQFVCPHLGCQHVVYAASSEIGQELISEHLAAHDEKMRLVVNEKNLTNLPVGNLIRRIREMAAFEEELGLGMDRLIGREVVQRAL